MRKPVIEDVPWIYEAYKDWPPTPQKGYPTFEKVENWVRRWIHRDDELCLVEPGIGLISWRQNAFVAVVDNIVVHPDHRQKGHANQMIAYLTELLFESGVLVAEFDTLPGPIRDKYGKRGRVTALDGSVVSRGGKANSEV